MSGIQVHSHTRRISTVSPLTLTTGSTITTIDGFTVEAAIRQGVLYSALYHHLRVTKFACLQEKDDSVGNMRLINEATTFKKAQLIAEKPYQSKKYILLDMLNEPKHNLLDFLPEDISKLYRNCVVDRHIRIDERFGSKNSKEAQRKLWFQWHCTERRSLRNQPTLVIHTYYHYGEFISVNVKTEDKNNETFEIDISATMIEKAREQSLDALDIILHIINNMYVTKANLQLEFEQELNRLSTLTFKNFTTDQVGEELENAYRLNKALEKYNERVIDKRLEQLEANIFKMQNRALINNDPTFCSSPLPPVPEHMVDSGDVDTSLEHLETLKISPRVREKKKPVALTMQEINSIKEACNARLVGFLSKYGMFLKKRLNVSAPKEALKADAKTAREYISELEELRLDIGSEYINAENKELEAYYKDRINGLRNYSDLYEIFKRFVEDYNDAQAIQLFHLVNAQIPQSFYSGFLYAVTEADLNSEQETSVIRLCKYFAEYSQDYRLLLSLMHTITREFHSPDGNRISLSLLWCFPGKGYFKLFKEILAQCSTPNITGFTNNGNAALLLYVFCCFSDEKTIMDDYINALLDLNAKVENNVPVAAPLGKNTRKGLYKFEEAPEGRSPATNKYYNKVHQIRISLGPTLTAGSALQVYCQAIYKSPAVLARLAKMSSIEVVAQAFSYLCLFLDTRQGLIYSKNQYGIAMKDSIEIIDNEIESNVQEVEHTEGASYFGMAFTIIPEEEYATSDGSYIDPYTNEHPNTLLTVLKNKFIGEDVTVVGEEAMQLMLTHLECNAKIYFDRGQILHALSAVKAMLLISTYRTPSVECHTKIVKSMMHIIDIYKDPKVAQVFELGVRTSQIEDYSNYIMDFTRCSKYSTELTSQLITEFQKYPSLERLKRQEKNQTKQTNKNRRM